MPVWIKKQKTETKFALFMAWILSPCLITLLGFYLGTIFSDRDHIKDLQVGNMEIASIWALVFLGGSILAAIFVTIVIPPVVERDYATREAKWAQSAEHSEHAEHH